ncbi:hypothetical protein [Phytoactinopolyspora mesophila]|uniref:Uncharacterized protein n=1 Tax=Phytoactinopolyspora mesophila TaxID=2650750 RepID=A0A7K3M6G3_9ACTN|nr:hypothetical protein [Phytoactinopolyspora mesophila]NDL58627.1 hypothetical protein [Phytoactinopolyspora mesophila]
MSTRESDDENVVVSSDSLSILLNFAKHADKHLAKKRLRNWLRPWFYRQDMAICSRAPYREPECAICQAFTEAERLLEPWEDPYNV